MPVDCPTASASASADASAGSWLHCVSMILRPFWYARLCASPGDWAGAGDSLELLSKRSLRGFRAGGVSADPKSTEVGAAAPSVTLGIFDPFSGCRIFQKPSLLISQDGNRTRTSLYGTRDFKSRASACFATWPREGEYRRQGSAVSQPYRDTSIQRRKPNFRAKSIEDCEK